jgi:predicted CXXCH cytochrome family protein
MRTEAWRMANHRLWLKLPVWLAAILLAAGLFLEAQAGARASVAVGVIASDPYQETESYCLSCHNNPDLSMTLPSGETLSLFVDPEQLKSSAHSPVGIECEACHTEIKTYPHPQIVFTTRRELSQQYYQSCEKCHSAIYEEAQDSVHAEVAADNPEAPLCTDCHGSHYIHPPDEPRSQVSTTCSNCHAEVYNEYKESVHGAALIEQGNPDVPVCTDCHGVHNIQDPTTEQFRIENPELCAGCHANEEMMAKYGLPADVYDIYKLSWHGVDVSVYKSRWPTIWHDSAVCSDCHGVHDIRQTEDPQSRVNASNRLETCRKCHAGVSENWTDAWTGHHDISPERTPWLFYISLFYSTLVPLVLWAAGIYVVLQIVRNLVDRMRIRARRST